MVQDIFIFFVLLFLILRLPYYICIYSLHFISFYFILLHLLILSNSSPPFRPSQSTIIQLLQVSKIILWTKTTTKFSSSSSFLNNQPYLCFLKNFDLWKISRKEECRCSAGSGANQMESMPVSDEI